MLWSVSYVKPNGILRYQSDAAHKLFNQIDRYITNWVGYCHPSSIFPWSRSLRKILYGWWVCGEMKHPDLRHDHLSILWQHLSRDGGERNAGVLVLKSIAAGANLCKKKKCVCVGSQPIWKRVLQVMQSWHGFLSRWDLFRFAFLVLV